MSTRVIEAIVSRWDSESLDDTFPGGIWFGTAPADTAYPFVSITSLGSVPAMWTSHSELRDQRFQLKIFYEETTGTDPVSAVGSLMRTLDAAICHAPLSIPASAGKVYDVRRLRDDVGQDPEPRIWFGVFDYKVMRSKSVDYSPE